MTISPPSDSINPASGPSLDQAAELLASQGRTRDAIALVEQALFVHPRDPDALLLLTLLLLGTGSDRDRHFGMGYLRRVQWRAPKKPSID
jgi:hypothetical protein